MEQVSSDFVLVSCARFNRRACLYFPTWLRDEVQRSDGYLPPPDANLVVLFIADLLLPDPLLSANS